MSSRIWRIASALVQAVAIAVVCWQLSPIDTQTVLSAASEYVRTTGFGPYDRLVYSHAHRRPFEVCEGADARHAELLERVQQARPGIEASSPYLPVQLFHLIRTFNRETQSFYTTECPTNWSYFYSYVDYQSGLMKVAPSIWVIDALHRSEIYIIVILIFGSWVGIFSLFWLTKRLTGSVLIGFASVGALWFGIWFAGPILHLDFRLNLFNTFTLVAAAQFLCDLPRQERRWRMWAMELAGALVFAVGALLLIFPRLPSTRLDATALIACMLVVAVIRWNADVLRRTVLVFLLVSAVQWPYREYSASLLAPVAPVNTAEAGEYKTVNAAMFLDERPGHFGNFILDYNFTWIFDADYYLLQLSPVQALHHGYPAWGRKFLTETALHHFSEFPKSWLGRFVAQIIYHREFSYQHYRDHAQRGTIVLWIGTALIFFVVARGRATVSALPLIGLVMWEVFGLHTFLALMHVHSIYLLKGVPMLWVAIPSLVYLAGREARAMYQKPPRWSWPVERRRKMLAWAACALGVLAVLWGQREVRKEIHVTRIWRAVHAGQYYPEAYLSPDALVREVDAIRAIGGEDPGTVTMYGAWALFGYLERLGAYNTLMKENIQPEYVKQLMLQHYERAMQEAPDNPHFYPYARYFAVPNRLERFREGLRRFPDHPYATMMNFFVAIEDSSLQYEERLGYYVAYDNAIRRQLREYPQYRLGFVEEPVIDSFGPPVKTDEGQAVTLLPGEIARIGRFRTYGSDRLALGVYLKVTQGTLLPPALAGQPGARIVENGPVTPSSPAAYRAWHFRDLSADQLSAAEMETSLQVQAGPQGARFIVRDLYPLVENPRWFR